jgi:hypothetical protein
MGGRMAKKSRATPPLDPDEQPTEVVRAPARQGAPPPKQVETKPDEKKKRRS